MSEDPQEPLLSEEESAALVDAMRSEVDETEAEPTALANPKPRLERLLPRVTEAAAKTCGGVTNALLKATRLRYDVTPGEAKIVVPGEGDEAEATDARWDIVHEGKIVGSVILDGLLVVTVLSARLGAPDGMPTEGPVRPPTPVELRVMEPLARTALDPVLKELAPSLEVSLRRPERFAPAGGSSLRVVIPMLARDLEGNVARVIVSLEGSLLGGAVVQEGRNEQRELMRSLAGVQVELIARLGRAHATIRSVLSLEEGSVIRLDTGPGDLLEVRIHDTVTFMGAPVTHAGNLALELMSAGDDEENQEEAA